MSASTIKMTAKQFLQLGEDPPGIRLELVDGEIELSPSPMPRHSYTDRMLSSILIRHVTAHELGALFGDVDTIFGENDVRRPDLIYFAKARLHLVGDMAMEGSPDLCVEILSSSSIRTDRKAKFRQYEKGKVRNYWIVDPEQESVEAWRLVRGKYVASGRGNRSDIVQLPPFPDLDIPLGQLWWRPVRK